MGGWVGEWLLRFCTVYCSHSPTHPPTHLPTWGERAGEDGDVSAAGREGFVEREEDSLGARGGEAFDGWGGGEVLGDGLACYGETVPVQEAWVGGWVGEIEKESYRLTRPTLFKQTHPPTHPATHPPTYLVQAESSLPQVLHPKRLCHSCDRDRGVRHSPGEARGCLLVESRVWRGGLGLRGLLRGGGGRRWLSRLGHIQLYWVGGRWVSGWVIGR